MQDGDDEHGQKQPEPSVGRRDHVHPLRVRGEEEQRQRVRQHAHDDQREPYDSITDFQSKLYAKGFKNTELPYDKKNGARIYDGTFMGEAASVVVFYNERSKQVYSAKSVIQKYGKTHIQNLFNDIEAKLYIKYGAENRETESVQDEYLHEFKKTSFDLENGYIILSVSSYGYTDTGKFLLHIQYADKLNSLKNTQEEMDDL